MLCLVLVFSEGKERKTIFFVWLINENDEESRIKKGNKLRKRLTISNVVSHFPSITHMLQLYFISF